LANGGFRAVPPQHLADEPPAVPILLILLHASLLGDRKEPFVDVIDDGLNDRPQVNSFKHAESVFRPMQPHDLASGFRETRPETDGPVNQPGIIAELENRPNPLDFIAEVGRPPLARNRLPQTVKIPTGKVDHQTVEPERVPDAPTGAVQLGKVLGGNLAGVKQVSSRCLLLTMKRSINSRTTNPSAFPRGVRPASSSSHISSARSPFASLATLPKKQNRPLTFFAQRPVA
jgi:hypothetical protein